MLLNFLNVRIVVNGKNIYTLPKNRPVVIKTAENRLKLVATDGFHITRPVELAYDKTNTLYLKVACVIDNNLFLTGLVLLLLLAVVGLISDIALFRFLSFVLIFYFLFYYYINRKDFLKLQVLKVYTKIS